MAKKRSGARKKSATVRRSAGGPRRARGGARKKAARLGARKIELRPIRLALKSHVALLGTAIKRSPQPEPQLEEALKRMSRWLDDIRAICGPNMMIPV